MAGNRMGMGRIIRFGFLGMGCLLLASRPCAAAELTVTDLTGSAVANVGPYVADVNEALRLFARGDYDGALKHLQAAKKSTPVLSPAEVMMAQMHFSAGQFAAGNSALEKAIQVAPGDPEPYVILIERAAAEARLTEAELVFPQAEKAIEAFSENPRRKTNLQSRVYLVGAAIDEALQKFDSARAKLDALVKVDPANAAAHQRLGRVIYAQGGGADNQKRAMAEFKLAADLDPKALPAELMMAILAKDPAKSEQWIEFALKSHADDLRTQLGAADFRLKAGQLDKAREHSAAALKLDPQGFDTNLLAGLVANFSGEYPLAVQHLSQAHLLQPANPIVISQLALALIESPNEADHTRALQFAEINVRTQPDKLEPQAALGWVYYRMKRLAEAERSFKAVVSRAGSSANIGGDTAFMLAFLAAAQGNRDDAVAMLQPTLSTKQLFVYRPRAEQLLAQLTKNAPATSAAPAAAVKTP